MCVFSGIMCVCVRERERERERERGDKECVYTCVKGEGCVCGKGVCVGRVCVGRGVCGGMCVWRGWEGWVRLVQHDTIKENLS